MPPSQRKLWFDWRTGARQIEYLPGLLWGRRFIAHFTDQPNNSLSQLDIGGQPALRVIQIVFQADPDMSAQQQ